MSIENAPFGDPIGVKEDSSVRIAGQNINGFNIGGRSLNISSMVHDLSQAHRVDIFGAIETNTNWRLEWLQQEVLIATKRAIGDSRVLFTNPPTDTDRVKVPGGCATFLLGGIIHRATDHGSDPAGRWSWVTIAGAGQSKLTVITSYRVTPGSITTAGSNTYYSQLWHWHFRKTQEAIDPRKEHLRELSQLVQAKTGDDNSHAIVIMDANESIDGEQINRFLTTANMVDLYSVCHSEDVEFATHSRGSRRIDFILGTPSIIPHLRGSGYTQFGMGAIGADHRLMFVDLDIKGLLRTSTPTTIERPRRIVVGRDPTSVNTYRQSLRDHLEQHRCFDRFQELQQKDSLADTSRWIQLHEDVTRSCLAAEKVMRRRHANPWSPELIQCRNELAYWQLWQSEHRTRICYRAQRAAAWGDRPEPVSTRPCQKEIQAALQLARQRLKEAMAKSAVLRSEFLRKQAGERAKYSGDTEAKEILKLDRAERTKASYARIRRSLGKETGSGLKHVLVPDGTELRSVTNPEEIEEVILQRNQKHFSQADGTPFTTPPVMAALGRAGTTPIARAILDPHQDTSVVEQALADNDRATLDMLAYLKRPDSTRMIDATISTEEFANGLSRWRESTSTSPSGVHLGHYKALLKWIPEDDEDERLWISQILELRVGLVNAAFRLGFSYPRWNVIHSSMLEKIPGLPRIDKLRVIHIFEADMNLALGILWGRRLMRSAETQGLLNSEQWGSRAGRSAVAAAALKFIAYSVSRLSGTDLATFDNDAKACYDRIVILLSLLRSQMLGMPDSPCQTVAELCQAATYHIKTALRVSDSSYASADELQLHGNGQGRRDSPAVWTYISTMGLDLMKGYGEGMRFRDVLQADQLVVSMISFVDDKTVWANDFDRQVQNLSVAGPSDPNFLRASLSSSAQRWAELLHATGGKLELPKCFYYLARCCISSDGEPEFRPSPGDEIPIEIKDPQGHAVQINQAPSTEPHKTLGVFMCPTGDTQREARSTRTKCQKFARHIRAATNLQPRDVKTLHDQYFIPSVGYSLPFACLPESDLAKDHSPVLQGLLPRAGFNRHFPRAIVHAPKDLGGLGWRSLYVHQGLQQCSLVLQHLRHPGELGRLLRIWLSWIRQWTGTSMCPFEDPHKDLPHLRDPLARSLRLFLAESHLAIGDTSHGTSSGDHIMDIALQLNLSPKTIRQINAVRLHLQVTELTDLMSADGTRRYRGLNPDGVPSRSTLLWPRIAPPSRSAIKAWRRFLDATQDHPATKLFGSDNPSREWAYRYYPETETLEHTATGRKYRVLKTARRVWSTRVEAVVHAGPSIPIDCLPGNPPIVRPRHTYDSKAQTVPPSIATAYPESTIWLNPSLSVRDHVDNLYLVSDGGVKDGKGSYGWVVATEREILVRARGRATGYPMTSFRAEAFGRWDALRWLRRHLSEGALPWSSLPLRVQSYTDSESLLKLEQKMGQPWFRWTPTWCLKGDYDILHLLTDELQEYGSHRLTSTHVKGHQDRQRPLSDLTWPERLNCVADELATQALTDRGRTGHWALPGTRFFLVDTESRRVMTSTEATLLKTRKASLDYTEYLAVRLPGGKSTIEIVDWDALRLAHARAPHELTKFITKWKHSWTPVNQRLHEIDHHTPPDCVCCGKPEDENHLWQCPTRVDLVRDLLDDLQAEIQPMTEQDSPVHDAISCIERWAMGGTDEPQTRGSPLLWSHALRGFLHHTSWGQSESGWGQDDIRTVPSRFIGGLWRATYTLWQARNESQHSSDLHESENRERIQSLSKALSWFETMANHPFPHRQAKRVLRPSYPQLAKLRTREIVEWVQAREETIPHLFPSQHLGQPIELPDPLPPPAPGEPHGILPPIQVSTDPNLDSG